MRVGRAGGVVTPASRKGTIAWAKALACVMSFAAVWAVSPAAAQGTDTLAKKVNVPSDARMLLQADQLVYDRDADTITAQGNVQISYGGYRLVADSVTYDQKTSRMIANGNVEIVEPDGNKIYSDHIDVTDDFKQGFVNALKIETPDKTRFAATSAERTTGDVTTFQNGVYTACEPCKKHPEKPPFWQVKARKIIWNGQAKTVRFTDATFEFFGRPIAYLPYFQIPDPTVKRKSGFLFPKFHYKSELGFGAGIPYFLALAPNYDLTVTEMGYTRQGFLTEAEWRQRLENGTYNLRVAGIHQFDRNAFSGAVDKSMTNRGLVSSTGRFKINPRWTFGWDVIAQSDKMFGSTYSIDGASSAQLTSRVYLQGLNGRNFFDLHAYKFNFQENLPSSNPYARDPKQPWVLPSLDYAYIPTMPVAGGELDLSLNARGIYRHRQDPAPSLYGPGDRVAGLAGINARMTAEAEWRRTFITPGGLMVTPLLALRGDSFYLDQDARNSVLSTIGTSAITQSAAYRYMATAGLELRWPILFSTTSSTHIIEPVAQIFLRPDEQYAGRLPNEDAQSFVFDTSTLFERDKFSGYDRVEGGSRANVGIRYSGTFANGWTANALVGQSYQLFGRNSFASPDFVNATAGSGLETAQSDYVGMVGASHKNVSVALRGRFDHQSFALRRAEVAAQTRFKVGTASLQYAYITARPQYGYANDRHEVTLSSSLNLTEEWRVFGSGTYDIFSSQLVRDKLGVGYQNSCFNYSMFLSQTRNGTNQSTSVGLQIGLRTIGDAGFSPVNPNTY